MKSTQRLSLELLNGWSCYTISGSDEENEKEGEGQEDSTDSGSAAGDKETGSTGNQGNPQAKIAALEEEKTRHFTARQKAEQERDELQKFKDQVEAEKLSDAEKAEKANREREELITSQSETIRRLLIENAFLADDSVKWNNVADALKLSDLSSVEVDEKEGKIKNPDALAQVIKDTAKAKPYLVTTADKEEQEEEETPPPGSGQPPAGKKVKTNGLDQNTLLSKFPALRSHV